MIPIYLCDDDSALRRRLQAALERKILIEDYDMRIVCSAADADFLLKAVRQEPGRRGIYFLDVELRDGDWDGFRLGKEIRRLDPHGTLIYVTGFGDLAYRTFQYHLEAFDYIVKDPEKLEESVARCLEEVKERLLEERRDPAQVYTLQVGETLRHIPIADILFFETAPRAHHILLHTRGSQEAGTRFSPGEAVGRPAREGLRGNSRGAGLEGGIAGGSAAGKCAHPGEGKESGSRNVSGGVIDFLGNLNEIQSALGEGFLRVHRAYLVALDKIEEVDFRHGRLRVGGYECLLSRSGKSELMKRL